MYLYVCVCAHMCRYLWKPVVPASLGLTVVSHVTWVIVITIFIVISHTKQPLKRIHSLHSQCGIPTPWCQ